MQHIPRIERRICREGFAPAPMAPASAAQRRAGQSALGLPPDAERATRAASKGTLARWKTCAVTPTRCSPTRSPSATRPSESPSRTSCASPTSPPASKRPRSRTASGLDPRLAPPNKMRHCLARRAGLWRASQQTRRSLRTSDECAGPGSADACFAMAKESSALARSPHSSIVDSGSTRTCRERSGTHVRKRAPLPVRRLVASSSE